MPVSVTVVFNLLAKTGSASANNNVVSSASGALPASFANCSTKLSKILACSGDANCVGSNGSAVADTCFRYELKLSNAVPYRAVRRAVSSPVSVLLLSRACWLLYASIAEPKLCMADMILVGLPDSTASFNVNALEASPGI